MQYCNVSSRQILFFLLSLIITYNSSCTFTRKAPKGKYYVAENSIAKIEGAEFSPQERNNLKQRLLNQLDDSAVVKSKTSFFFINVLQHPPVYDSAIAALSARNMKASMWHLGYYKAEVNFKPDTSHKKIHIKYYVNTGKPTLIDTVTYRLRRSELQSLSAQSSARSLLKHNEPVTKAAALGEIGRLVDTFRNNGYFKFTAAELRLRGDTTIEALTSVSDDPFEQLRLLAEAQQKRDSPTIRLAIVLNPPSDSSRLTKYYINKIFILPDFYPGDVWTDPNVKQIDEKDFSVRYREYLFRPSYLRKNLNMRSGDVYRQREFISTVNNFSRAGVWKSVNARLWEVPGDSNKVNLVIELLPGRKFASEASIGVNYSAVSNTNNALGGNLFGLSLNLGLTNNNIGKEAIRMTHGFRAGIELNNNSRGDVARLVNSQELSYTNSISIPSFKILAWDKYFKNIQRATNKETFLNTSVAFNNRLDLFNTQSANMSLGWRFTDRKNNQWVFRMPNVEFSYLFNQTDSFNHILEKNPFLRFSYTSAFIVSMGVGFSRVYLNPKHPINITKERSTKFNVDVPFLPTLAFSKYLKQFIKADAEYKYTIKYPKTSLVFRGFAGVGIILGKDSSLPFFKQFFAGGSNSMRAWPIRGIGLGSQPLAPYGQNVFNNRNGDLQIEGNAEYRYNIANIIPNTLVLRGALFVDAGNIWNLRNSNLNGDPDEKQFKFSKFYKEIGVAVGTGFRIDMNYFVVRFDLGFRVKRPELSDENAGWKLPNIGFDDMFSKIFGRSDANKRWRYENFNFTFGISYPF